MKPSVKFPIFTFYPDLTLRLSCVSKEPKQTGRIGSLQIIAPGGGLQIRIKHGNSSNIWYVCSRLFIYCFMYSLIYLLIYSFIFALIHLIIYLFVYALIHWCNYSLIHWCSHSCIHVFIYLSIYFFIDLHIYLSYSFIHSFIYFLSICSIIYLFLFIYILFFVCLCLCIYFFNLFIHVCTYLFIYFSIYLLIYFLIYLFICLLFFFI